MISFAFFGLSRSYPTRTSKLLNSEYGKGTKETYRRKLRAIAHIPIATIDVLIKFGKNGLFNIKIIELTSTNISKHPMIVATEIIIANISLQNIFASSYSRSYAIRHIWYLNPK